jgi:hypothetical protein
MVCPKTHNGKVGTIVLYVVGDPEIEKLFVNCVAKSTLKGL